MNKSDFIVIEIIALGLTRLALAVEIMDASTLSSFANPTTDQVIAYGETGNCIYS